MAFLFFNEAVSAVMFDNEIHGIEMKMLFSPKN